MREALERAKRELEEAENEYDLNKAAELRHGRIPQLEKQLKQLEQEISEQSEGKLLREEVTEEEIAEIVSRWTGIPLTRLVEGEREKLLRLHELLHRRVIGQDEAVELVADAVLRARAGMKDPNRPIGSFCSSDRPASAKRNWPKRSPRRCLTVRSSSSVLTCPSIWKNTPSPA
ncbi:hypothetical protein DI43_02545 [Geobacillus sp. CAMR12739]|nr:hypothetical protein DI43_02545 [Geobacillus sp. CAMR12739]